MWRPIGHLWFIPLLILATLVVVVAAPWRGGPGRGAVTVAICAASIGAWGVYGPVAFTQGVPLVGFFLGGAWVTHDRYARFVSKVRGPRLVIAATLGGWLWLCLGLTAWVTPPTYSDPARTPLSVVGGVLGATAAAVCVLALSVLLARRAGLSGGLAFLGRISLQVYLAHIAFTAGLRIVLMRFGVSDPAIHLVAGTVAGVLGSLLIERITRPLPWLFAPPRSAKGVRPTR